MRAKKETSLTITSDSLFPWHEMISQLLYPSHEDGRLVFVLVLAFAIWKVGIGFLQDFRQVLVGISKQYQRMETLT